MFKESFKRYKSKTACFDDVFNFDEIIPKEFTRIQIDPIVERLDVVGLSPVSDWEVYGFNPSPGLIYVKNPFTAVGQRYWPIRCLKHYTRTPNKTNLDIHYTVSVNDDIWTSYEANKNTTLLNKLRWATLGYHHNWDTKIYTESMKSDFPSDLSHLSSHVAKSLGFKDFKPEAAIINFYHMNSTLSGHTDHSEWNLEAPLLSFSFGQSAIFLLGGKTLDVKPMAMFLNSGDVVVMSGESRLCYHGVPKIVKAKAEVWNCDESDCESRTLSYWEPFSDYLSANRINVNVRQVLNKDEHELPS